MFCSKCGKNIEDNSKFCGYCGAAMNSEKLFSEAETHEPVLLTHVYPSEPPVAKPPKKKIHIKPKKLIALILVLVLLTGGLTFAITYETSEKALENIIENSLSGDEEELDKYFSAIVTLKTFGFSRSTFDEISDIYEGKLGNNVERLITSDFDYYFDDDDYDIDWEIVSEKKIEADSEEYGNLDVMKGMLEYDFISTVFHPQIFMGAVEYEVEFTAQELGVKRTANVKFLLVNYNMKWYLTNYYEV